MKLSGNLVKEFLEYPGIVCYCRVDACDLFFVEVGVSREFYEWDTLNIHIRHIYVYAQEYIANAIPMPQNCSFDGVGSTPEPTLL